MRTDWNAYSTCLCTKEGEYVEMAVSPRVVRGVVIYKENVVIGCSRSVLLYRFRQSGEELSVRRVCEEIGITGELIGMRVYENELYVLLNKGSVNVLLRWNGNEWLKVSEVCSEMRLFVVFRRTSALLYGFAGRDLLLKRGDECIYKSRLNHMCLCMESVGEEVWLGSGNGELYRWTGEGMECVYKLRSGIKRIHVYENEVLLCGMDGVLLLLYGTNYNCIMKWMNSVDGCLCEECILVMRENDVCCLCKNGMNGEIVLRSEGLKYMYKNEEVLLCGKLDGVLLKSMTGRRVKQVSFCCVC